MESKTNKIHIALIMVLFFISFNNSNAYQWHIDILDDPSPGYLNSDTKIGSNFYLLDHYAEPHFFDSVVTSDMFKLLPDGSWIGSGGKYYYLYSNDFVLIDSLPYPEDYQIDNHDVIKLSNGHYLFLCTRIIEMDLSDVVEGGYPEAQVIEGIMIETDRDGTIYNTWAALDHYNILDIADTNELKLELVDFPHFNSLCEDRDNNILASARNLDEVTKLNLSTGEIVWRLGGSRCIANQFTFLNDQDLGFTGFSHQHSINLLPNGNLLMYDNGAYKISQYSRAVEYQLNVNDMSISKVWEYRHSPDIFQAYSGNVQRLYNGNTLINWGNNKVTEVKPNNTVALEYYFDYPNYRVFKSFSKMNVVYKNINSNSIYSFNESNNSTNVTLNVTDRPANGLVSIEKHKYRPPVSQFDDNDFSFILPYRWVLRSNDLPTIAGILKINISTLDSIGDPSKLVIFKRDHEASGVFNSLITTYNQATGEIYAEFNGLGEFVICLYKLDPPILLKPENNKIGVKTSGFLSWKTVERSLYYWIQVSNSIDFQQLVVNGTLYADTIMEYSGLEYNKDYFWRVKAINSKDSSQWSDTFKMTTTLPAPTKLYPNNNAYGIKLSDTLKWQNIINASGYKLQISSDSTFINIIDWVYIQQNYYKMRYLLHNKKYYWRISAYREGDTSAWSANYYFNTSLAAPVISYPGNDSINIPVNGSYNWSLVSGAQKYHLQLSKYFNFTVVDKDFNNIQGNLLEYQKLDYNQKYFIRIRSIRSTDSSDWSIVNNFTTELVGPQLLSPSNNSSTISPDTTIRWQSYTNAEFYNIQVAGDPEFENLLYADQNILETYLHLYELPHYQKIYWKVKAVLTNKQTAWSEIWNFETKRGLPVQKPILKIPDTNSFNVPVFGELIWNFVPKAIDYTIQVSDDKDFKKLIINVNEWYLTNYPYSSLNYLTDYYWRLKAFTKYDSSEWSDVSHFRTIKENAIQIPKLTEPEDDELLVPLNGSLIWEKIDENMIYNLQMSLDFDFNNIIRDKYISNDNEYQYSDLNYHTNYFWRVRSVKSNDTSEWSDIWNFKTEAESNLPTPVLSYPLSDNYSIPVNGTLYWQAVENASSYRILISKDFNFKTKDRNESGITDTHLKFYGLEYNQKYYWKIAAISDSATSKWSEIRSFTTVLGLVQLISPNDSSTGIPVRSMLKWTSIQGADAYHLKIAKDEDFKIIVLDSFNVKETIIIIDLDELTTYYWRVQAYNNYNTSELSRINSFTTRLKTGIENDLMEQGLIISPNPASDFIFINFNLNQITNAKLVMTNELGQVVFVHEFKNNFGIGQIVRINLPDLPNGVYLLSVLAGENIFTSKLIINN